ncbi:MAG: peptidoglycan DD-metalloendopeptidase family protein [candidate division WOR-3 bacterium]
MKVIKFGNIIIFVKDFPRTIKGLAVFLTVIISILFGGLTFFYLKFLKKLYSQRVYTNLIKENQELRKTMRELSKKLDDMYNRQRVLASVLNVPLYDISSDNFAIGGQIRDVDIDKITSYAKFQEDVLNQLEIKAKLTKEELKRIPSIPPIKGVFSSGFGIRKDPFTGGIEFHKGIDISAPTGTPIVATADGVVEYAGWNSEGYGNQVVIDHENGIKTRYAHMFKVLVKEGQRVKRGQVIGLVGSTGKSVAPHVHYEVYLNGNPVNPTRYILVDLR